MKRPRRTNCRGLCYVYTYEDRTEAAKEAPEQKEEQDRLMLEETRVFARQLREAGVEVKQSRKYAGVMLLQD